jgi:hypothetical protein
MPFVLVGGRGGEGGIEDGSLLLDIASWSPLEVFPCNAELTLSGPKALRLYSFLQAYHSLILDYVSRVLPDPRSSSRQKTDLFSCVRHVCGALKSSLVECDKLSTGKQLATPCINVVPLSSGSTPHVMLQRT